MLAVVLAGFMLAGAWLDVRAARGNALAARQTMLAAAANPSALSTPEGRAATRAGIDSAVASLDLAHERVSGSATLRLAAKLPFVANQRAGLVQLIDDSRLAAAAGRDLLRQVEAETQASRVQAGRIPLDGLRRMGGSVRQASGTLSGLVRPEVELWGPLGDARRQFDDQAQSTAARLDRAAELLDAALGFFGAEAPRRYFLAFQNNAEMRDQGMVLSYGILRFTDGAFALERTGSIGELTLNRPAPTPIPPGTHAVFGSLAPTQTWQSVNATADFAFTGRAIVDMYQQATGTALDGVVGIDVPALAGLLRVIGPVGIEGLAEPITDANVARVVLKDFYEGIETEAQNRARRERLADVVRAVLTRLTQVENDPLGLGRELGRAAAGGHLRLWSADADEEEAFERNGLGGAPGVELPDRTFHVAIQNRTATKLDYYINSRVEQNVELTESGDARVLTTVVVENSLPPGSPPSFAIGPDSQMSQPGEYAAWLILWSPAGAQQPGAVEESGLQLSHHVVIVNPGERKELTFRETVIPNAVRDGEFTLRLVPQPRLAPIPLEVNLRADGWEVEGSPSWAGPWDSIKNLTWKVSRDGAGGPSQSAFR
ncbi:MAG: DUF4012 domain-containing protein [Actinomycetota bacterium]|nr:DUF4012 domain-containing protein [Actinomycetota bacterium]